MTDDLGNVIVARNKTYFPNVNTGAGNLNFPLAPGVAEGQARMKEIASQGTYASRRDEFRKKYNQFTLTPAEKNLQQFDVNRAKDIGFAGQGFAPQIQSSPIGTYQVSYTGPSTRTESAGVVAPYSQPGFFGSPAFSAYSNFGQRNRAALGNAVQSMFPAMQGLYGSMQNMFNRANSFFSGNQQRANIASTQPRRYFDEDNNY